MIPLIEIQTSNSNGIWLDNLLGTESNTNIWLFTSLWGFHLNIACDHSSGIGQFTGCPSYLFDNSVAVTSPDKTKNYNQKYR